jgi:hypothetical protein
MPDQDQPDATTAGGAPSVDFETIGEVAVQQIETRRKQSDEPGLGDLFGTGPPPFNMDDGEWYEVELLGLSGHLQMVPDSSDSGASSDKMHGRAVFNADPADLPDEHDQVDADVRFASKNTTNHLDDSDHLAGFAGTILLEAVYQNINDGLGEPKHTPEWPGVVAERVE